MKHIASIFVGSIGSLGSMVLALGSLLAAAPSDAAVITLDSAARGWVDGTNGYSNGRDAGNTTFTGWASDTGVVNSWFGFDLSTVSGTIVSAELLVDVDGYVSPDPSETLVLYHVETPPGVLGTVDSLDHFADLMTGDVFGSRSFTPDDPGHLREIPLSPAAIADIQAADGGIWEVGGHISTLSLTARYESIFWGAYGDPSTTRLRVTSEPNSAPEPTALSLMALGLTGLALRRKRHGREHDGAAKR